MRLQSIILPTEEKHRACRKLFYRNDYGIVDPKARTLSMGYAQCFDFVTYLNACSWKKIRELSGAKKLSLELEFSGKIRVTYVGYTKSALTVNRKVFGEKDYSSKTRKKIVFHFPENNEQMVGFEISALEKSVLFGGGFDIDLPKKNLQKVVLSIATTTCHKEEFIKKNVALIRENLLESKAKDDLAKEIRENLYLKVIDNGRSLSKKEIFGRHVELFSNQNVGGSGGYARGMIESLHQDPKATHVLLMDDDVLVLPESISRTYALLRILKPEFRGRMISGAMLYYERPEMLHEDIGTVIEVNEGWNFRPLKNSVTQEKLKNNLETEYNYPEVANSYAAWWYCCIPTQVIKKNGLPLPLFIRCDDSEYGLRCNTGFLTLNGICIWHMGFVTKNNAAFDIYQNNRNMLVATSCSELLPGFDLFRIVKSIFRREIVQFNYNGAELAVRALEDYMRGPEFLKTPDGEKIVQENYKLNDVLKPLSEIEDGDTVNKLDIYANPDLTIRDRFIAKYLWNGHRFTPKFLEDSTVAAISFDWQVQLHRIIFKTKLIAINPFDSTAIVREKDRAKFKVLHRRYKKALRDYKRNGKKVAAEYAREFKYLTSEKFWRKYLNL